MQSELHDSSFQIVYEGNIRGFGLRTLKFIQANCIIQEYRGEITVENNEKNRKYQKNNNSEKKNKSQYTMQASKDCVIDAHDAGSLMRFINEPDSGAGEPNCVFQKKSFPHDCSTVVFVCAGNRDITPGSILQISYGDVFDRDYG